MKPKIFRQIRNDAKDIRAVADGYKTKLEHPLWLADGLQKDAIQNSWDARISKKRGIGWECGFSLKNFGNKDVLCIVDKGTTGLDGTKFTNEKELVDILNNNQPGEDLACFLNSNWTTKSGEEGGTRGRGKTLFLAASHDKKIFFDSLRSSDNTYVCGSVYLDKDNQVKFKLNYDKYGERALKKLTNGKLAPLAQHGTRILIINPLSEVKKAIKSGEIFSFISYSRWEIIKKYEAKIFVEEGNERKYANLPNWYEDKLKSIESKEFPPEVIKEGTRYKIKRLVLRYAPDQELPELAKGIAIQRGGMTIQRIMADTLVREEGMSDIYGWLEMEAKPLEEEIKLNCEGPEHLSFNWTIKPAKHLRDYIRSKVRLFAKELKIIVSEQTKKNKAQRAAEESALRSLVPLFKKLGLFGKHLGKKTRKKTTRRKDEPLRLSAQDIEFPRESRRVNYEEKIERSYVVPINDTDKSILVFISVWIVSKKGVNYPIEEKIINLFPGRGHRIGLESIEISKAFKKGEYSFRALMRSQEETDRYLPDGTKIEKGTRLYERINQKFYVEIDPPSGSGPFRFQARGREDKAYLLEWEPDGDRGYIIFYNDLHPRIKPISEDEKKLTDYLIEQTTLLIFQIKLEEVIANNDKSDKDFGSLIKSKDLTNVWPLFLEKYSEFLWNLKNHDGIKN